MWGGGMAQGWERAPRLGHKLWAALRGSGQDVRLGFRVKPQQHYAAAGTLCRHVHVLVPRWLVRVQAGGSKWVDRATAMCSVGMFNPLAANNQDRTP